MPAPVVAPIAAQTLDGWDTATITATASNSPTSWTFTVVTGSVTLAGSNATRTFRVPPQLAAGQVVLSVTASNASGTSPAVNAVVNVKPWPAWVWVGQLEGVLDDDPAALDVWDGNATTTDRLDGGGATSAGRWAARSPLQNANHTFAPTASFIDAVGGTDFIDAVGASDLIDGRGA